MAGLLLRLEHGELKIAEGFRKESVCCGRWRGCGCGDAVGAGAVRDLARGRARRPGTGGGAGVLGGRQFNPGDWGGGARYVQWEGM